MGLERGGARVAIYEGELVRAVERKLQLVRDLRVAVATKDFRVEYQPIVGLADQHVYGVEALLRWGTAPSPTAYPPSEFIPIAEENGLIVPLGRWVINRAIESRVACRGSSRLMLNNNLSARQLSEPDIVESIDETLRRTGMSASRVGFEITETLAVHDIERAARVVSDIRALGCRVGIDDFGTGYSSLARLQELKVDFIKIDQSFVSGLGRDRAAEALVAATLALARELRLEVVAEGVETKAQAQRLEALGCTFAQGYFLGRPRASLATLLRRNVTRHHGLVTVHHE